MTCKVITLIYIKEVTNEDDIINEVEIKAHNQEIYQNNYNEYLNRGMTLSARFKLREYHLESSLGELRFIKYKSQKYQVARTFPPIARHVVIECVEVN